MQSIKNTTQIDKWGNSSATRIPKGIIQELNLVNKQTMEIKVQGNSIVLTPIDSVPNNIHELFKNWQDDGKRDQELDWGDRKGNEMPW
jgi:antitoxin MazE